MELRLAVLLLGQGELGRVNNTSLFTSSVTLLTSPESKVGAWVDRTQISGLLVGVR